MSKQLESNNEKHTMLMERIEKNMHDYNNSLMHYDKQEIVDMASEIKATTDAYHYLTGKHDFTENEIDYLLNFIIPLEVISDEWQAKIEDTTDLKNAFDDVIGNDEHLQGYYGLIIKSSVNVHLNNEKSPEKEQKQTLSEKLHTASEKAKSNEKTNSLKTKVSYKKDERN